MLPGTREAIGVDFDSALAGDGSVEFVMPTGALVFSNILSLSPILPRGCAAGLLSGEGAGAGLAAACLFKKAARSRTFILDKNYTRSAPRNNTMVPPP